MRNQGYRTGLMGAAIAVLMLMPVPATSVTNAPSATPDLPPATAAMDLDAGAKAIEHRQYDLATKRLTRAIDSGVLTPEALALAYHHRGIARQKLGFDGLAILDYTKAMEFNALPHDVLARSYYNRGLARANSGDTAGAELDYSHAIEDAPTYAAAYHNRANLERERHDYQIAIRDYSVAIKNLEGDDRKLPLMGRAIAYQKSGNIASATADIDQLLKIDPSYAPAAEMRRQLALNFTNNPAMSDDLLETGSINPDHGLPPHNGEIVKYSTANGWDTKTIRYDKTVTGPAVNDQNAAKIQAENDKLETASLRAIDMVPAPRKDGTASQTAQPVRMAAADSTGPVETSVSSTGNYRIQIGAFRRPELAAQAWKEISRRHAPLVVSLDHSIEEADLGAKGIYFRLQAGSFATADLAKARCADFTAQQIDCIAVTR